MRDKKNAPEIRFKGFSKPWEEYKIAQLLIERNEQAPKNKQFPLMAFVAHEGVVPKGERYDRGFLVIDEENKKYKRTFLGDFIYSSNNLETGSIGLNRYGCASISPVYSIFQSTNLSVFEFIGQRLIQKDFINKMVKWRQGVIYGQWRIHETDFVKIEIYSPEVLEQQKIGKFFSKIDNLIKFQQQKIDKLQNVKKSMLDKMFPKNGNTLPEIRFKGFSESWEESTLLKESSEIIAGGDVDKNQLNSVGKYPVIANALTNEGIVGYYNNYYRIKAPAISVTGRGDIGHAKARIKNFTPVVRLIVIKTLHNEYFMENVINKTNIVVESTGVPQLTVPQIEKYEFCFPQNIDEEIKIGKFFSKIDDLIKFQQQKLEKLKNIKKSMLDKMFV